MGFSSLPLESSVPAKNTEQPIYIPALLMMSDDEMINSNVGVFYDAPGVKHEDYFAFTLMKNMFGSYRIDQHAEHLNDVHKQYNSMHALLGNLPVVTRQMNYCGVCLPTIWAHYLNDVEVIRGRNAM